MKYWILSILLPVVVIAHPFAVQAASNIVIEPSNQSLQITGWLGEESALIGNLRLTAPGENIEKVVFLTSDLRRKEGGEIVNRQQITIIGEPQLSAGIPQDFQVRVNHITLPGTYEGTVQIFLPSQSQQPVETIPVEVIAKVRPNLIPVGDTEQIQLRLVNCDGWLGWIDCSIARGLLPASAFLNQWELQFDNPTQAPVTIIDSKVILKGEQTGYQITTQAVSLPKGDINIASDRIISLPLNINRCVIPPDRYIGAIYLTLSGQNQRLIIPVDLKMRSGPILPLLVLIFGVLLGRLFKYMQESGGDITRAIKAVYRLKSRIKKEVEHPDDQRILERMIDWVEQLIRWEKIDKAFAEIDAIESRLEALSKLREIENKLMEMENESNLEKILQVLHNNIAKIRVFIAQKNDIAANRLMQAVMKDLANLYYQINGKDSLKLSENFLPLELASSVNELLIRADAVSPQDLPNPSKWEVRMQDLLILISGVSDDVRIGATVFLIRPFLSLTLLVGLSLVGLGSLYVDNGVTFGSRPFSDYLGLILWGISADVTSRNISSLQSRNRDNDSNII
ncbi:hypothetical protein CLI64_11585 [Nostoc sp. CENA543]|uniref:hypothetical protein n=1 Tax=Nostoc sp. CENA543 TaxID=1869241 RepID=UPI000CA3EEC6|nr:hypothetical protein [Nostoc sp. CENA543]AUT00991.1 hypothetical protein CLI64_11585 [Nostoc sp. CENA543]